MANNGERKKKKYKKPIKNTTIVIIMGAIILLSLTVLRAYKYTVPVNGDLEYTQFQEMISNGEIVSASVIGNEDTIRVTTASGENYSVINPGHDEFKKELLDAGVSLSVSKTSPTAIIIETLSTLPMMILMIAILMMLLKTIGGQTTTLFKVLKGEEIITFDDVAGMSETKKEVAFAVSQLKNKDKLKELGARPCKGIILEGPPGTGKTLLAKAIAGEAGVPFISTSGADFVEMFAGLGAARVRSLWELAELNAPCVVFIDEIDAVGRRRSSGGDGANTEANQTLNALLQRMDGLGSNSGIFVVGATNRISDLDPALLRPGRFDKHLFIGPPKTKHDRDEIITVHMKNKKFSENFDFDSASKLMFGLSGAEIEQVLNESVLISLEDDRNGLVETSDIDKAAMKLRASGVAITHSSESDRQICAVHESGHAVVSLALGRKVSKVSITPYSSGIGGATVQDTDGIEDKKMKTRSELMDDIKILLAGREAERIVLGDTSVGCSNDIERATAIAYNIVNSFAMTEDNLVNRSVLANIGINLADGECIISQMNGILLECRQEVETLLYNNREYLDQLKEMLIENETVIDVNFEVLGSKK